MKSVSFRVYKLFPINSLNEVFEVVVTASLSDDIEPKTYNLKTTLNYLKKKKRKTMKKLVVCDPTDIYEFIKDYVNNSTDITNLKDEILKKLENE